MIDAHDYLVALYGEVEVEPIREAIAMLEMFLFWGPQ
jgi:hypothetical protein